MSDNTDSDSSSISSTYHSDVGEVTCFISKADDFSGSDEGVEDAKAGMSILPSEHVNREEADQILSKMGKPGTRNDHYPASVATIMHDSHPDIVARITEESIDGFVFFYPPGVLAHTLGIQIGSSASARVLCDVCVFSPSRTTLMLTFTQGGETSRATDYNSQLSRSLIDVAGKAIGEDISVVHGVIDEEICRAQETFNKKLTDYKKSARLMSFPSFLNMTDERLKVIMKCFLGLHGLETDETEIFSVNEDRISGNKHNPESFTDIRIFPGVMYDFLNETHADKVSRLRELPGRGNSVILAAGSLLSVIDREGSEMSTPNGAIFDACVFAPREPVLVLTITSDDGKKEAIAEYNSHLTRRIVQAVRRNTRFSFGAVNGVVEESLCQTRGRFEEKVYQLQRDAHVMSVPSALVMTQNKCLQIIKPILQLLTTGRPPHQPESPVGAVQAHGYSSFDFSAMMQRIEQLEQDSQKEKEEKKEMTEKFQQEIQTIRSDSQKEQKEMTEKYDHVLAEMEKIKQDYLTDTRLSLLMRPRSSSVSESTVSGYGSTEVDVDMPHKQGAVAAERDVDPGEVKDTNPSTQPELTTEAIQTGNLELVQYNRDITLHQACDEGKLDVVQYILSQGLADINCRGKWGRTPVMAAAWKGQVTVFDYLISQGCDLSVLDDFKDNVLHIACMGGNVDIVRKLIVNKKCDEESRGRYGRSAVMRAAYFGNREVFELLVGRGCDVKVVDNNKDNILHVACIEGKVDMVQYILSQNIVSIESRDLVGRTPVMTAAMWGHKGVFDFLVRRGCDVKVVDNNKDNILHVACIGGNVDIVQYILSQNIVSIESRGNAGRTPVMTAAVEGHKGVVDFLVRRGCDVKVVDNNKDNILHVACIGGNVDIVQYILSLNIVSIESRGNAGRTPVMTAAVEGHKGVVDFLVRRGCDVKVVDNNKDNILHVACYGGNVDMVQYILSQNIVSIDSRGFVGRTPVMAAAEKGHKGVFDFLVGRGCDVKVVDNNKESILHLSCYFGHVDIVKHILSHNMVSTESRGQHGRTPVMQAVRRGHIEIFDLLNSKNCNLRSLDDEQNNILHVACEDGHVDMVKYLMTLRAVEVMEKVKNKHGETPVQVAERRGHIAVVSLLKGRK